MIVTQESQLEKESGVKGQRHQRSFLSQILSGVVSSDSDIKAGFRTMNKSQMWTSDCGGHSGCRTDH